VIRNMSLALVLMAMAGVASASEERSDQRFDRRSDQCVHIFRFTSCRPSDHPSSVKAPEIDPASAMAGLTMLAGGLAVLRGRRRVNSKE
jgi:hypothetical protein